MKSDKTTRAINSFFNRSKQDDVIKDTKNDEEKQVVEKENEVKTDIESVKRVIKNEGVDQIEDDVEEYDPELDNELDEKIIYEEEKTISDDEQPTQNQNKQEEDTNEIDVIPPENEQSKEADQNDITTSMKEIDRLNGEIQLLKEKLEATEIERDKNEKLYLELKDILVNIGLTKELNILENIKTAFKSEQERSQFLEKELKQKEVFIESLKNGIFSGINQLFDQKPPNQIVGKTEKLEYLDLVVANSESKDELRNVKPKEEGIKEILQLAKEGKTLAEIAEITKKPKQSIYKILKAHENNEEKGA